MVKFASLLGVALRGSTLLGKLLLLLLLAKMLPATELGTYGLLAATINYSIFVLGLEFYTYSTREFISGTINIHHAIKNQAALIGACYLVASPALIFIAAFNILPTPLLIWFLGLLAMEHFVREGTRLLVARGNAAASFVVSFISGGLWPWVLLAVTWIYSASISIQDVLRAWAIGVAIGCGALLFVLRDLEWSRIKSFPIHWDWIGKGLRTSFVNLIASASIIAIVTFDKYAVEAWVNLEMVGIYVFFSSLAFALVSFIEAGVVSTSYPILVRLFQQGQQVDYAREIRLFGVKLMGATSALIVVSALTIRPLLQYIQGVKYSAHLPVYWLLLTAVFFWVASLIPHYALYARKRDNHIAISNLLGAVIAALGCIVFSPTQLVLGTAVGVALGFLTILICKSYFLLHQCSATTNTSRNAGAT